MVWCVSMLGVNVDCMVEIILLVGIFVLVAMLVVLLIGELL